MTRGNCDGSRADRKRGRAGRSGSATELAADRRRGRAGRSGSATEPQPAARPARRRASRAAGPTGGEVAATTVRVSTTTSSVKPQTTRVGPPPRRAARRVLVGWVALAFVVIGIVALAGGLAFELIQQRHADATQARQQRFIDTATQTVVNMFSYTQDTIDQSVGRLVDGTSGPLRGMLSANNNVENIKAIFRHTNSSSDAPPHALFAKLAFLANNGPLIRPALEKAIAEDPEHPEVFILFGNLALAESRATDAAVHFEKARALAAGKRWAGDQRNRFDRLSLQGDAVVAESRGDWKAARTALSGWLKHEPSSAVAHQRLGKALFHLEERDAAYEELEQAAKADAALEPAAITMAWLFSRAGNLEKAEEWINYAGKTAPESLAVQKGSAAWLMEQGRADEAQRHADAAAKLDPGSTEIKRLLGLGARGSARTSPRPSRSSRRWRMTRLPTTGFATSWPWSWLNRPTNPSAAAPSNSPS